MSPSKLELGVLSNGCLADCKSVVFGHWRFESVHSHKQGDATVVRFRNREDKKPKCTDELLQPWTTIIE